MQPLPPSSAKRGSALARATLVLPTAFSLLAPAGLRGEEPATLILRGAAVYTLDPARPRARALVVRNGRIAWVGDEAGTRAFEGEGARVIDLEGRMVLPGFHDAHTHPMTGGMRLLRCSLDGLESASLLYAAIRKCAAERPGGWLVASGWSPKAFPRGEPTLSQIDRLVPDRPAFLTTADGFVAWVNSRALLAAGIDPNGKGAPVRGVHRDRSHKPTGVVEDEAAGRIRRLVPPPSRAEYREALRLTTAMANRVGITSLFDASVSPEGVEAYHAADLAGELTVRVVAAQRIDQEQGAEQVDDMTALRDRVCGRRFRADAAKIFLDGEIDRHTAAMLEPYAGSRDERGKLLIAPERLNAIVSRLDAAGFLVHMHAMGDRAVRAGLDAIERAIRTNGPRDRRHQLAHVGVADPDDVPRFGRLGVAANLQPFFAQADDPVLGAARAAVGPERARWMYPLASIAGGGGRVLVSSDWPSTPMNPLESIQVAMTRQPLDRSSPPFEPGQRMHLEALLAACTRDAAWAVRDEALDGTIEVGKAADLVVLDRDLFEAEVPKLHDVRVMLTLLEGEPVYRDSCVPWPVVHAGRSRRR
jgi:predicted amidohydrolase YtcJ